MRCNYCWLGLTSVALLMILSPRAAAVVLTTVGFEDTGVPETRFVAGAFPQQGWLHDEQVDPPPQPDGPSVARIVAGISAPGGGTQSLRVERTTNSDRRWALPVSGQPTGRHIVITWDMAVQVTNDPGVLGPFMGVEAYDGVGSLGLFGSLGVDATTGEVLYQQTDTGFIAAVPNVTVDSMEWNSFAMVLDMEDQQYRIYMNATELGEFGFVDRNLGTGLEQFTDADIATFAGGQTPEDMAQGGFAWFDNFVVRNSLLAGDFNGDNVVDAADYTVWRNSLGQTGLTSAADGNADGVVDVEDYLIWKSDFGMSSDAGLLSPAQIPEPATTGLILLGLAATAFMARRVG